MPKIILFFEKKMFYAIMGKAKLFYANATYFLYK